MLPGFDVLQHQHHAERRDDAGQIGAGRCLVQLCSNVLPNRHLPPIFGQMTHQFANVQWSTCTDRSCRGEGGRKDVGEQTLMHGLDTAFPFFFVWGCPWSSAGRRSDDRPHNGFQDFPLSWPHLHLCTIDVRDYPLISVEKWARGPTSRLERSTAPDDITPVERPIDAVSLQPPIFSIRFFWAQTRLEMAELGSISDVHFGICIRPS